MTAIYTAEWHQWHKWTNEWSTRALFGVFAHLGVPKDLLDVGCADGHLVKVAASLGIDSVGFDIAVGHEEGPHFGLFKFDLGKKIEAATQPFEMVLSWEVAEHLPPESADTFCDTLAGYLAPGGHLVFTAAHPGQGGHGHINEQPQEYWRQKLTGRGLTYDADLTKKLKTTWEMVVGRCHWYHENIQIFSK